MKKLITLLALAFCLDGKAQVITTFAGNGIHGYSGDGAQATAAEIYNAYAVAFDATGNMYISDQHNQVIRKVDNAGIITTVVGNGLQSFSGDGGQASAAAIFNPLGIVFDITGNLYIADSFNHRIRKVNTLGIITTVAGGGSSGLGDGGQATAAQFNYPAGLATDALGNLYITDYGNNRIRMVNTLGIINTVAGNGSGAGTYTCCYSGDGGQATAAGLSNPDGVAVDSYGNIYIADQSNHRIRMVNTAGIISTFAGTGTGAFSGDGGQASTAELNFPYGVNFDAAGNLYIADAGNERIRMVSTSGIITTIAGNGTYGYSGDGGQAIAAELYGPEGVTFDASGNLYIADKVNYRIRKVTNVGQTTSINNLANSNELNLYPNPNNGSFVIEPSSATKQILQVYDVNGKMVLSQTINGKTSIDASSLNDGIYNIGLQSTEGVVNKRLVIVR